MSEPAGLPASDLEIYAYTSVFAGPPEQLGSALESIRATSARRNPVRGITGALVHDRGRFLQVLEGQRAALDHLAESLTNDARHHDMKLLVRAPIKERTFSGWSMAAYDTEAIAAAARSPAEESDLARMTEAFRANFRLVSVDYFECMARLLSSHSSMAR
jgi:hypothetical protein